MQPDAALHCTHGMAILGDPGADEMGVPSRPILDIITETFNIHVDVSPNTHGLSALMTFNVSHCL